MKDLLFPSQVHQAPRKYYCFLRKIHLALYNHYLIALLVPELVHSAFLFFHQVIKYALADPCYCHLAKCLQKASA